MRLDVVDLGLHCLSCDGLEGVGELLYLVVVLRRDRSNGFLGSIICVLMSVFAVLHLPAGKRVRFKPTTTEATSEQVVEAMAKIASHIGNPSKFSKASKLTLQLLQSGSVTSATADPFFFVLKAAMTRPSNAIDAALRRDYQTLFAEVHERLEVNFLIQI